MKMKKNEDKKIEFRRGNPEAPLSGTGPSNLSPNKDNDKKGTSEDISKLERKRVDAENEAKRQKTRENKK